MQGVWDLGEERVLLEIFNSILNFSASENNLITINYYNYYQPLIISFFRHIIVGICVTHCHLPASYNPGMSGVGA